MIKQFLASALILSFSWNCYGKGDVIIKDKYRDLGIIKLGTVLKERYWVVNPTNKTIKLRYVNPECSCTSFKFSSYNIPPNDSIYIDLTVDTKNKFGEESVYTIIKTDTKSSMYKLTMKFVVEDK